MDPRIDYYALLGVLASAEDIVIQGAYRALAQRYHPVRYEGRKEEANSSKSYMSGAILQQQSAPNWLSAVFRSRRSII